MWKAFSSRACTDPAHRLRCCSRERKSATLEHFSFDEQTKEFVKAPVAGSKRRITPLCFVVVWLALGGCEREAAKPPTSAGPTQPPKSEAAAQVEQLLNAGKFREADKLVDEYAPSQ